MHVGQTLGKVSPDDSHVMLKVRLRFSRLIVGPNLDMLKFPMFWKINIYRCYIIYGLVGLIGAKIHVIRTFQLFAFLYLFVFVSSTKPLKENICQNSIT